MKKILSIACIALVVAALASCKKTYVTNVVANQTWISDPIQTSDWTQTADGKADSVDLAVNGSYNFFDNKSDATLVYFSFVSGVYEQIPEVYNGVSYSYFHYSDNQGAHIVLYSQPVNGGTPVKPTSSVSVKLVLIPSELQK
ncbi:hypothetical protein FO440_02775 [Mucilaginibacter corticis]|uniref:Uncharacterized protein n=1 Tax=Mucilaginibacter corticis TaxID=2597670 RepID=A0A556MT63_9SPHI|nr:hypothetical protein [Mucilaginibacter corticis]TSJ43131.1 hypothetical protein FO440_02775 [Mucilaginibacter corticis]